MENKTTTELLDIIHSLDKADDYGDDWNAAREELLLREPFYSLRYPRGESTQEEELDAISEDIKKLKRHKHEPITGDVLIRI